jgi:biotin synthase
MNAVESPVAVKPLTKSESLRSESRPTWTVEAVLELYELPFLDLVFRAAEVHRQHFNPNEIQRSALLSVKTGGCSEDCGYCSQAKRNEERIRTETGLSGRLVKDSDGRKEFKLELPQDNGLMKVEDVVAAAKLAKDSGASRFCMGAAWRGPKERDLAAVEDMVRQVKALGMETCVTLGMLKEGQAERLKDAGLDYYNHNLDSDEAYYKEVVTTHTYQDRLDTLQSVRDAGLKVCSGGIIGMGESRQNRAGLLVKLANMDPAPESVPINHLVAIPGTAMAEKPGVDHFEFVRTIAAARITMPTSFVRLSAGRQEMTDELQAMCFMAGANSIFYGEKLLTTGNPEFSRDQALFDKLKLQPI